MPMIDSKPFAAWWRRGSPKKRVGRLLLWLAVAWSAGAVLAGTAARDALHVGFSSTMFTEINENDARAVVKGWCQTIAKQRSIDMDPDSKILKDAPALLAAFQANLVDAAGMTALEFHELQRHAGLAHIFVCYTAGRNVEQYVLLVRQDSKINCLTELRGRGLITRLNARCCLAQSWLDILLAQNGLKLSGDFFGKINQNTRLSKVVLPVFFRQADACLVNLSGFETMKELNPQIGRELKVLASSPQVVPVVFVFRASYAPAFMDQLLTSLNELHQSPAGQQVLAIFQSERIEERPAEFLAGTMELIETHERILAGKDALASGLQSPPVAGARKANE
jgi:phosphonate transport system substrate-binding protein